MKKITLLLSFIIPLSTGLLAQDKSNFTISTTGNSNLKIVYAGKKFSLQDRNQTFQNQTPGTYTLVIYQWQNKPAGAEYIKVYDGNVKLTNQKHLELTVLRFGKTAWDEGDIAKDEWNENYTNPSPINEQSGYNNNNSNGNNQQIVTATQYAEVKKALGNEYNEEERFNLSKVVLKNKWFSITQIKELAQTFYSEEKKLRFVKVAYDFCLDKGNYFTLTELFYSSTYKKDLITYLGSK